MRARHHLIALAAISLFTPAMAQDATPRVEVTGSLIKRTDKETPSPVQTYSRDDIRASGAVSIEELLRGNSAVDTGSIGDSAASGFVGGLSTISLRGMGSQGTLLIVNGRRLAPVAAVDINFGRATLISANMIPTGAIDKIEVLKDGASSTYGSDAVAGVVNYILLKNFQGVEGTAKYSANDKGKGPISNVGITAGWGDIDKQRFNILASLEYNKRDRVMFSDIKDRGDQAGHDAYLNLNNALSRFTPDSSASLYANYYRLPASTAGTTTLDGRSVANSNLSGVNYLGTLPGCPDERTVGKGVPNRPDGFASTTASLRTGFCRFNLDNADETIAAQDRISALVRGTFAASSNLQLYGDLLLSRTKTNETRIPYTMTTTLATTGNRTGTTWPMLNGTFRSQEAIILPAGHPDNPTNGTATSQPVQLIYRFEDLPLGDINTLEMKRLTLGAEGSWGAWDYDAALVYNQVDNKRVQQARVRSSLLTASIASGTYRFGKINTPEAIASVSSDATNDGHSKLTSIDLRASRALFDLPGGKAQIAVGVEYRKESLEAVPDANYLAGDYIGLVANGASGSRNSAAVFTELSMPMLKSLELLASARQEHYSDFGDATTGKVGFKWTPMAQVLALRGTAASGFRAPSIAQIGNSYALSFHSTQERRVFDNLRCNLATSLSKADPAVQRDCNVLGFTNVPTSTPNPGSIPTVVSANPNLKPETSRSLTLGLIMNPAPEIDFALDAWYYRRNNEIRSQRGLDIMEAYNADPVANAGLVVRDPNPQTWLPGIPNSGPIILLVRGYGNYEWTKTSGIDFDINVRFPTTEIGKFSLNVNGSYTARFDQLIVKGQDIQRIVGTSTSDIPKTRASATLRWKTDAWNTWLRHNHSDKEATTSTASCQASTTAGNVLLQQNFGCVVGHERTVDLGVAYTGIKNLILTATVFNIMNDYNRSNGSTGVPSVFQYWDPGLQAALGRRFTVGANYVFK